MNAKTHLTTALILVATLCAPAPANLLWVDVDTAYTSWAFDSVLQEVTIIRTIRDNGAYSCSFPISGEVDDIDTTFTMTWILTNNTEYDKWTEVRLSQGGGCPIVGPCRIIGNWEVADVTKLKTIEESYHGSVQSFSGAPEVLPGETMTIVLTEQPAIAYFKDRIYLDIVSEVVPEPTTALLLALGGFGLRVLGAPTRARHNTSRDRRKS